MPTNPRRCRSAIALASLLTAAAAGRTHPTLARPVRILPKATVLIDETITPSPLFDAAKGSIPIRGTVADANATVIHVRVTTGRGQSYLATAPVKTSSFECNYPGDFAGAPPLTAQTIFVDATADADFNVAANGHFQAEATLLIYDTRTHDRPDLPSGFTNDLLDAEGHTDTQAEQFPAVRALVNLYYHSEGARTVGWDRTKFDLAQPADLAYYKKNLALFDYANRDRDWSTPLGHRPAGVFWSAVWPNWFGPSNDNPIDGNRANTRHENYQPYSFTNDFSDLLLLYLERRHGVANVLDDNLTDFCHGAVENLLAMQSHDPANFAANEKRANTFTAGAFHYGMFIDGSYMTEGNGWFISPDRVDHAEGGVFNGRAMWALGEALQTEPAGPQAEKIKAAMQACANFCLCEAQATGTAHRTKGGHFFWRDPGEHGYLLSGLLAACAVDPQLPMRDPMHPTQTITLKELCIQSLDALLDIRRDTQQWTIYADEDAVALAALARGIRTLPDAPHVDDWKRCAVAIADAWLAVKPADYPAPMVNFAHRPSAGPTFSFPPGRGRPNEIAFFVTGHWIRALAEMYAVTGDTRYADRSTAMIRYLCGANPWHVRLLTETGGIYNAVQDSNGDGIEDRLNQDLYPESTSFCGLGINAVLEQLATK